MASARDKGRVAMRGHPFSQLRRTMWMRIWCAIRLARMQGAVVFNGVPIAEVSVELRAAGGMVYGVKRSDYVEKAQFGRLVLCSSIDTSLRWTAIRRMLTRDGQTNSELERSAIDPNEPCDISFRRTLIDVDGLLC